MTRSYISITDNLSRLFGLVAVLLLIAAMLVVCQMIFLRYFFRLPTIWQTDFVVYSATAAIFLGAPYVLMKRAHVSVDVVESLLTGKALEWLQFTGKILGLIFCAIMCAASAKYVWEAWSLGWKSSSIWQVPIWIPAIPMPIGFGLVCLQYVAEFLRPKDERP